MYNLRQYFLDIKENTGLNIQPFFNPLAEYISGFRAGRITVIGAYTGIGKTYTIANILDIILKKQPKLRVLVVSTEMEVNDYEARIVLLRAGLYENHVYNLTQEQESRLLSKLGEYEDEQAKGNNNIEFVFENIFENLEERCKKKEYDLVIIDYIQDMVVQNKYKPEETMPILSQRLKSLKKDKHVMVVSQINNKHKEGSLSTLPFAYGTELGRVLAHAIVINRIEYKNSDKFKENFSDYLLFSVSKNRYGKTGKFILRVQPGHKFSEMSRIEQLDFDQKKSNLAIT